MAFLKINCQQNHATVAIDNNDWSGGTVGGQSISPGSSVTVPIPANGMLNLSLQASQGNLGNQSWVCPLVGSGAAGTYFYVLALQENGQSLNANIVYTGPTGGGFAQLSPATVSQCVGTLTASNITVGTGGFAGPNLLGSFTAS